MVDYYDDENMMTIVDYAVPRTAEDINHPNVDKSVMLPAQPAKKTEEVVEEFAGFPNVEHDDLVDSSTQALLRFRQGGFIPLPSDEEDEPLEHNKVADYY